MTWTNAPAADPTPISSPAGKAVVGSWVTFNLTPLVAGDGTERPLSSLRCSGSRPSASRKVMPATNAAMKPEPPNARGRP